MAQDLLPADTDFEWLDHVQPVGLVFARGLLKSLTLSPERQTKLDDEVVAAANERGITMVLIGRRHFRH